MGKERITAEEIKDIMMEHADEKQRAILMRFFKTGKGQYGEGDSFLGIKVPKTRELVKEAKLLVDLEEIQKLLYSKWHEIRLFGFLLLVEEMKANTPKKRDTEDLLATKMKRREEIAGFYLRHARQSNNWDLVDLSSEYIVGVYLRLTGNDDYEVLYQLAESDNLWEQRIAIVSTLELIRHGIYHPTIEISNKLLSHPHDLIHKAIGWMLREIGKRDKDVLLQYLKKNFSLLPRTSLRYAIERLPEPERKFWLTRKATN